MCFSKKCEQYSSGQILFSQENQKRASKEAKFGLKNAKILFFFYFLIMVLIQCGQAAKISPPAPAASELLDIMQATQPHQQCHALQPQDMSTEDKLVLSPIVFQGKSYKVVKIGAKMVKMGLKLVKMGLNGAKWVKINWGKRDLKLISNLR